MFYGYVYEKRKPFMPWDTTVTDRTPLLLGAKAIFYNVDLDIESGAQKSTNDTITSIAGYIRESEHLSREVRAFKVGLYSNPQVNRCMRRILQRRLTGARDTLRELGDMKERPLLNRLIAVAQRRINGLKWELKGYGKQDARVGEGDFSRTEVDLERCEGLQKQISKMFGSENVSIDWEGAVATHAAVRKRKMWRCAAAFDVSAIASFVAMNILQSYENPAFFTAMRGVLLGDMVPWVGAHFTLKRLIAKCAALYEKDSTAVQERMKCMQRELALIHKKMRRIQGDGSDNAIDVDMTDERRNNIKAILELLTREITPELEKEVMEAIQGFKEDVVGGTPQASLQCKEGSPLGSTLLTKISGRDFSCKDGAAMVGRHFANWSPIAMAKKVEGHKKGHKGVDISFWLCFLMYFVVCINVETFAAKPLLKWRCDDGGDPLSDVTYADIGALLFSNVMVALCNGFFFYSEDEVMEGEKRDGEDSKRHNREIIGALEDLSS
jgi:hypothetical protein